MTPRYALRTKSNAYAAGASVPLDWVFIGYIGREAC